jgi:hypothetical protein
MALGGLVIVDTARSSCSLPLGRPTVQIIFRGKPLPTKQQRWGHQGFGPPVSHVLRPGEKVFYAIGWDGTTCPNPAAAPESRHATLAARFRGGFRLLVPDTPPDRYVALPGCGETVHPTPWIGVSRLLRYR